MLSANAPQGNFGTDVDERLNASVERFNAVVNIIMQNLRVAAPGIVQSFNSGPPVTVNVRLSVNEYVTKNIGGNQITNDTTPMQLPLLQNLPLATINGGGFAITVPVQVGDEVMVVFQDTAISTWLQNGGLNNTPASQRRHSLSGAVAFPVLRSRPRTISGYSQNSLQIRNDAGDVVIDLAGDQITVTAPKVHVECSNEATVHAQNTVTVTADTVSITGTSSVTLGPHTTIDSHIFLNHVHSGVQAGLGTTGPVV